MRNSFFMLCVAAFAAAAASGSVQTISGCDSGATTCTPGTEGCRCTQGLCFIGLQCLSSVCVVPGGPGGAGGVGGTGGISGSGGTSGTGGISGTGGCSGTVITCYPDQDADEWPTDSGATTACDTCPVGLIPAHSSVDCDDGNAEVFPGNQMFYATCRMCGAQCCTGNEAFDYNCDGISELRWPDYQDCQRCIAGWTINEETIPECGVRGDLEFCQPAGLGICSTSNQFRAQECR